MRDWSDEPWVKLYTRKNGDWLAMPWEARVLMRMALTEFDRAGFLDLGRRGAAALGPLVGLPEQVADVGLRYILEVDKAWKLVTRDERQVLFWPNYVAAQHSGTSDRLRQQHRRERDAAAAMLELEEIRQVTEVASQFVTDVTDAPPAVTAVTGRHRSSPTSRSEEKRREEKRREERSAGENRSGLQLGDHPGPEDVELPEGVQSGTKAQKPRSERQESEAEEWFAVCVENERREKLLEENGAELEVVPLRDAEKIAVPYVNAQVKRLRELSSFSLFPESDGQTALSTVWCAYLDDPSNAGRDPAYSFRYFCNENVFRKYLAKVTA